MSKTSLRNFDEPIITVKEARKILGKNVSDRLSDEDLARVIGWMHKIVSNLIDANIVPKNRKEV